MYIVRGVLYYDDKNGRQLVTHVVYLVFYTYIASSYAIPRSLTSALILCVICIVLLLFRQKIVRALSCIYI